MDSRHGSRPEGLADDGRVVGELLELERKGVEPGGDERVDALGDGDLGIGLEDELPTVPLQKAPIEEHPCELLRVERVACGPRDQRTLYVGGQSCPFEKRRDQLRRLIGRKGAERDRHRVALSAAPGWMLLEHGGTRGANDE